MQNSFVTFVACAIAVGAAIAQAVVFFRVAWKRSLEIGITKAELKQVTVSTSIFSIIPSLPVVIGYLALTVSLGKFVPWLRVSVLGSVSYETMAAQMAAESLGIKGLGAALSAEVFGIIFWVMTLGIMTSFISMYLLKPYEKSLNRLRTKVGSGFADTLVTCMFLGMMSCMLIPRVLDFSNVLGIITILGSTAGYLVFRFIAKKVPKFSQFVFSLSMLTGMTIVCIANQLM